jgi:O-antigen ligase
VQVDAKNRLKQLLAYGNPSPSIRDALFFVSVALFPLFFLTVRGWTNGFLLLLFLLAITYSRHSSSIWRTKNLDVYSLSVVLALASGFIAILVSQTLRWDFSARELDGPLRMLLAIPVFLAIKQRRIDFVRVFQYTCPISLLLALLSAVLFPFYWWDRLATYFVDPITLGNYALVLGFLSLFSLNVLEKDGRFAAGLKLAGFLAGIYLSIWSQTRSGWLAAPVLLAIWLIAYRGLAGRLVRVAMAALCVIAAVAAYYSLDMVRVRVHDAHSSLISWMSGQNPDTALGVRLTMWRMTLVLFFDSPFFGYGDQGYQRLLDIHPYITAFASPYARLTMQTGPHNELLASMLRSGIFGMVSTLLLFLVPAFVFFRGLASKLPRVYGASLLGLGLVVGLFLSSFGEQVFYLKFLSSFYGLMIASLCATALSKDATTRGHAAEH